MVKKWLPAWQTHGPAWLEGFTQDVVSARKETSGSQPCAMVLDSHASCHRNDSLASSGMTPSRSCMPSDAKQRPVAILLAKPTVMNDLYAATV